MTASNFQPKDYQRWLNLDNEDVADIIAPPPSEGWIAYPVNRRVNSPKNDDARQIEPESWVVPRRVVYESCSRKAGICAQLITAESLAG